MPRLQYGTVIVDEEEKAIIIDGVWFNWHSFEATKDWDIDGLESRITAEPFTTDAQHEEEVYERAVFEGAKQGGFIDRD